MTRTKIMGTLFVPVIALSVFANQLYRQAAHDLSAWKGGGMGMFASADAPKRPESAVGRSMRMNGSGLDTLNGNLLLPHGAGW
jgi:hypothetical protein